MVSKTHCSAVKGSVSDSIPLPHCEVNQEASIDVSTLLWPPYIHQAKDYLGNLRQKTAAKERVITKKSVLSLFPKNMIWNSMAWSI